MIIVSRDSAGTSRIEGVKAVISTNKANTIKAIMRDKTERLLTADFITVIDDEAVNLSEEARFTEQERTAIRAVLYFALYRPRGPRNPLGLHGLYIENAKTYPDCPKIYFNEAMDIVAKMVGVLVEDESSAPERATRQAITPRLKTACRSDEMGD